MSHNLKIFPGHLCGELRKRAWHESKRSLVNQILTLASFSFESNQIEETIMKIRQFLDVETFNEVLLDFRLVFILKP